MSGEEKGKKKIWGELSRRDFVKSLGGSALIAGTTLGGLTLPGPAEAAFGDLPKKWDITTDVLIIGSGFAGLAAAIEAKNAGAKTMVIEKMPVFGGNSIINGGDFSAAGTKMQKEAGINDSPELMLKDMLKAGLYLNHVDKAKIVAEKSNEALEWCINYIGANFARLTYHGGHSVKRSHQTVNASGSELVNKLLQKARELGVTLENKTKLTRLIMDKKGRVVGAEVKKDYKFPDESSGKRAFIRAKKAVILAAGGFSRDVRLRLVHDPRLDERFDSTNQPGATGEVLLAAGQAGAMTVHLDWIQLGPWASPDEKGFGYVPLFCERLVGYGPMIDPKTGKRFFKETGNRKERADAIILLGYPVLIMGDAYAVHKQVFPQALEKGLQSGAIKKFDTLQDLAKFYGIPEKEFLSQIERWNSFVEKKKDDDLDCMIFPDAKPMATPPFYAARLWPKVHYTMGGLYADKDARVIGFDFKPIAGLYAAGEIVGAVHGAVRLGGVAMATCIVFGRIAGQNAAREQV
ncbi:MAG: flavocytochrome c [Syntrophales bacterium]|nr:flavocytochrome c [Syntrophales bacterium]